MWAHAKPCVDAFNDEKLAKVKEVNSHDLLPGRRQMACVRKKTIRECAVGRLCRVHVALKNIAVRHMLRQLLWLTSQRALQNAKRSPKQHCRSEIERKIENKIYGSCGPKASMNSNPIPWVHFPA